MNERKQKRNELIIGFIESRAEEPITIHEFIREFSSEHPNKAFKSVKSAAQIIKDISVVNPKVEFDTSKEISTIRYIKKAEGEIVCKSFHS
jgi:hypothetical protein